MKKHIYLLILLVAPCAVLYAQSIERQVIGTTGNSVQVPGLSLDYTVGEVTIQTATAPSVILTQGFHQGDVVTIPGISPISPTPAFSIYPNPASDALNIEALDIVENVTLKILSLDGRTVVSVYYPFLQNERLQIGDLNSGIYILQIQENRFELRRRMIKL